MPKKNDDNVDLDVIADLIAMCSNDWRIFARDILEVNLDSEMEEVLLSAQHNKMTSVASGTARGKDFVAAVAAFCFLYLTPKWNINTGEMIENTKVAMTAPTDRQVGNIMFPEISRLYNKMVRNGFGFMGGRLTGYDIRTENKEWFLTGFKASNDNHEAWSGFHAANTMFVVTEASGISDDTFSAIEGNLHGNSRILIVFNPNISVGYAAKSQKSDRWKKFRLDSLTAPNVLEKRIIIPGQVDHEWVTDKVKTWCTSIDENDFNEGKGDFLFDIGNGMEAFRPNDLFRVKVRGMFPEVSEDSLIPQLWLELAYERHEKMVQEKVPIKSALRLGVDVAGMGRDSSSFVPRYGNFVSDIDLIQSAGKADHMAVAGRVKVTMEAHHNSQSFIDTIGEGAGVYSRLVELGMELAHSVKASYGAVHNDMPLTDITGTYKFLNMRAFMFWALRDWLNPAFNSEAALPRIDRLTQELTEIRWQFMSNGTIKIESKEAIQSRLGFSPDISDALANTFFPVPDLESGGLNKIDDLAKIFF